MQVLHIKEEIDWISGGPPIAEPMCGFRDEKCISEYDFQFSGCSDCGGSRNL